MQDLRGKVAVVTGGASGIGLAVVEALLHERCKVVLADVDAEAVREHRDRLAAKGHEVHAVVTDVRDPDSVEALAEATTERFGGLHVAVNNAGVANHAAAWELPLPEWHRVIDINLWGVIHGVRSFVPRILATGEEGHVVNTGSRASVHAIGGLAAYTATKHAVLGLSDVLRKDLDKVGARVGVSVLLPGMVKTATNPSGATSAHTAARNVLAAIVHDRPYVYTDDDFRTEVEERLGRLSAARDDVVA